MSDTECQNARQGLAHRTEVLRSAIEARGSAREAFASAERTMAERRSREAEAEAAVNRAVSAVDAAKHELDYFYPEYVAELSRREQLERKLAEAKAALSAAKAVFEQARSSRETYQYTVDTKKSELGRAEDHVTHMTEKKNDAAALVREKCNE